MYFPGFFRPVSASPVSVIPGRDRRPNPVKIQKIFGDCEKISHEKIHLFRMPEPETSLRIGALKILDKKVSAAKLEWAAPPPFISWDDRSARKFINPTDQGSNPSPDRCQIALRGPVETVTELIPPCRSPVFPCKFPSLLHPGRSFLCEGRQ